MHNLQHSYRGLRLVMQLNGDFLLCGLTIIAALMAGAWLSSLL